MSRARNDAVIVAAAGRGERFQGALPKALEIIAGRPLLSHCLVAVSNLEFDPLVVVTSPATHIAEVAAVCAEFPGLEIAVVVGGSLRSDSIAIAMAELPTGVERVFVHDAARAFAPPGLFNRVRAELMSGAVAVVPVLPPRDTLKEVSPTGEVVRTVDRTTIRSVQTPQGFGYRQLADAYASLGNHEVTDDAALMEIAGHRVQTVVGDPLAFKVTDPFDRYVAAAVVAQAEESRNQEARNG